MVVGGRKGDRHALKGTGVEEIAQSILLTSAWEDGLHCFPPKFSSTAEPRTTTTTASQEL